MGTKQTASKYKYNQKTYTQWRTALKNKDFETIEDIRKQTGLSRTEFLKLLVSKQYNIDFAKAVDSTATEE